MKVRLFSGEIPISVEETASANRLEKECLICYEGEFKSIDGPVSVDRYQLEKIAQNYNAKLAKAKKLEDGSLNPGHVAPIQLDHGEDALETIGRVPNYLRIAPYKRNDGKEVSGLYSKLLFIGRDNVERASDGRFANVSIGADFEEGELNEITITPSGSARGNAIK